MSGKGVESMPTLLDAKREAVRCGDLISINEMSARLHRSRPNIDKMLRRGELFALDVDHERYIPAFLDADPSIRRRIWNICRIIQPAPAESRLAFLLDRLESPSNSRPVDLLTSDSGYVFLQCRAKKWASKWSRTSILLFDGRRESVELQDRPMFEATHDIDPRYAPWSRAVTTAAGNAQGVNKAPIGRMTLFLCKLTPPDKRTVERRLILTFADLGTSLCIHADNQPPYLLPLPSNFDIRDARRIVRHVSHHMARGGRDAGASIQDAAAVLSVDSEAIGKLLEEGFLVGVSPARGRNIAVTLESLRSYRVAAHERAKRDISRIGFLR